MKTQDQIAVTDLFPEYQTKYGEMHIKNRAFTNAFEKQSHQLECPSCGGKHTVNELLVNNPEFEPGVKKQLVLECPETHAKLEHIPGEGYDPGSLVLKNAD